MNGFDRVHLRGALWAGGCLALAAAILLSLALSSSAVPAPKRTAKILLDHYECYAARSGDPFQARAVKLKDQFGSRAAKVAIPETLCNPVSKNESVIRRRDGHLFCYRISTKRMASRDVTARNQFGALKLRVVAPYSLCLPSGKSETGDPQPVPRRLDHYECYRVKPLTKYKRPSVALRDQFWETKTDVVAVYTLCNPVSKNGGRVVNTNDHLVCYVIKPSGQFEPRKVVVSNQFDKARAIEAVAARFLCLPSTKREVTPPPPPPPPPPPGQPDLTVQILPNAGNPMITVFCSGGQGTCKTTPRYRITNVGAVAVAAGYQVRITADGTGPVSKAGPALAAGASAVDMQTLPPVGGGNNCYDPNCTVTVTVDSTNVVAESNEGNNVDTFTAPG